MRLLYSLLLAPLICFDARALACRYNAPPSERISRAMGSADTLAIGSVETSRYLSPSNENERAWTAKVHVQDVIRGKADKDRYNISRTGQTTMCDDGVPLPSSGDKWAIYIGHVNGEEIVELAYPLKIAFATDPTAIEMRHAR